MEYPSRPYLPEISKPRREPVLQETDNSASGTISSKDALTQDDFVLPYIDELESDEDDFAVHEM
jgi:hypothetical protein